MPCRRLFLAHGCTCCNWYLAAFTLLLLPGALGCQKTIAQPKEQAPPVVRYLTPVSGEVVEFEEFTGRTAAAKIVEVRSRVSGYLQSRAFRDGDTVAKDQVLFEIDPRPFAAEEERTAANIKQFEARVKRLELQEARAKELFEKQAISQDDFETIKYDLTEAKASQQAAVAAHAAAKLNLDFTKVTAPIAGRISRRLVDEGNLVKADDTLLVTIVATDPVYVYFDVDERTLLRLRRLMNSPRIVSLKKEWDAKNASAENELEGEPLVVNYALADQKGYTAKKQSAQVTFEDNQVDAATGTLRFRAVIDNQDGLLSPGLFMRLQFPIGDPHPALLVPESLLISDQGRRSVYVIGSDDKVKSRDVTVGVLDDYGWREILTGLEPGDRVVSRDLQRVPLNKPVTPEADKEVPSRGADAPPADAKPTESASEPKPVEDKKAVETAPEVKPAPAAAAGEKKS